VHLATSCATPERIGLLSKKLAEQAVDMPADLVDGRHRQLALTAREVVIEAALWCAGNFQ
jgi:hypothetical protein